LKDADRQEDTADHHLGEMAQLKSDEEDKSWKKKSRLNPLSRAMTFVGQISFLPGSKPRSPNDSKGAILDLDEI
jgi:hypothetical protein